MEKGEKVRGGKGTHRVTATLKGDADLSLKRYGLIQRADKGKKYG